MKKFVLIVAGGSGSRMKSGLPKQFIEIAGLPVLMHTFEVFYNYDPDIEFVLVLPEKHIGQWENLCQQYGFRYQYKLASGGNLRFQSVKNGLALLPDEGIVFIHDGVRPLVSKETLHNCFEMAVLKGNALPVISVPESIRMKNGEQNHAVDRNKYFLVQTPQTFNCALIKKAYFKANNNLFTDDATVLESLGEKINLVEGNRDNIKITFPEDLLFAEAILS